ncbi:MAG: maleylpyruvate isomerase family mycothiol-dependent enzyme [Nocardioides sp.]|nr:maleylpyruvate isomerase family mycothiol-dependent enzyme [Nocardioides sp.]
MNTDYSNLLALYDRSLDDFRGVLDRVDDRSLRLPTPCTGWDVADLLAHVVEENHRFRVAVTAAVDRPRPAAETGSVNSSGPAATTGPTRAPEPESRTDALERIRKQWEESVAALRNDFAEAQPEASAHLEGFPGITVALALRMQLLDTVVHAWDLAQALGLDHRPATDLVSFVAGFATVIATRSPDGTPGVFAGPLTLASSDLWDSALAALGRTALR